MPRLLRASSLPGGFFGAHVFASERSLMPQWRGGPKTAPCTRSTYPIDDTDRRDWGVTVNYKWKY